MAQTYSGEVAYVGSKAAGKGTAYFFYVKGIQNPANPEKGIAFNCGFTHPGIQKGDNITFSAQETQWGAEFQHESLVKNEEGTTPTPPNQSAAAAVAASDNNKQGKRTYKAGATSRDKYWEDKEARDIVKDKQIAVQASLNTATAIVKLALEADALALGSTKAKKFDNIKEYVFSLADEIYIKGQNAFDEHGSRMTSLDSAKKAVVNSAEAAAVAQTPEAVSDDFDDDIPF